MSDDDDAPAIGGDMEPELKPGDAEPSRDDDVSIEDAEEVSLGRTDDTSPNLIHRRGHPKTKQVRELFAKAAADLKRQLAENGGDGDEDAEDAIDYDEPEHRAPGDPPLPAASRASPLAKGGEQGIDIPGQAPPAPLPEAEITRLRQELSQRTAELDQREQGIGERERASEATAFRDTYVEKGAVHALRDMLKRQGIAETDEEWTAEVADLVTDLSGSVLGVPVPQELKNRIAANRALRATKANRQSLAEREADLDRRQKAAEAHGQRARALDALGKELAKEPHAKAYPFLAATDNPADIVWDVIEAATKKGEPIQTWTDAAKRANDYLQQQVSQQFQRWRHLLEPQRSNGKPPERRQGDPQVSRSMTPATQPELAPRTPPKGDAAVTPSGKWSNDLHRRNTKRMMRQAFRRDE